MIFFPAELLETKIIWLEWERIQFYYASSEGKIKPSVERHGRKKRG